MCGPPGLATVCLSIIFRVGRNLIKKIPKSYSSDWQPEEINEYYFLPSPSLPRLYFSPELTFKCCNRRNPLFQIKLIGASPGYREPTKGWGRVWASCLALCCEPSCNHGNCKNIKLLFCSPGQYSSVCQAQTQRPIILVHSLCVSMNFYYFWPPEVQVIPHQEHTAKISSLTQMSFLTPATRLRLYHLML